MSGSIFGSLSPFVNAATQALGFGSASPVTLGPISFANFEVPEVIAFSGKQKTVVHTRPGGQRLIDALGPDDHEITWSGKFLGPDASIRAQQLDVVRVGGQAITLSWGQFSYQVVISDLTLDYRLFSYIDYRISCIVLRPNNPTSAGSTLLGSIVNDLNSALGINLPASLSAVSSSLQQITPLVSAVTTLAGGSPAALNILGAVNQAQNVTSGLLGIANGNIASLTAVATSFTSNTKIISGLGLLSAAVNTAPPLDQISGYLGRMAKNLTNPSA